MQNIHSYIKKIGGYSIVLPTKWGKKVRYTQNWFCWYAFPFFFAAVCRQGDLRLQGGRNANEGRVEFCNNNAWGTVCDDLWGTQDAQVACRQLGFSANGKVYVQKSLNWPIWPLGAVALTSGFTNGAGPIWLDNVRCTGLESDLTSCPANAIGQHNCVHIEDAGVRCQPATSKRIIMFLIWACTLTLLYFLSLPKWWLENQWHKHFGWPSWSLFQQHLGHCLPGCIWFLRGSGGLPTNGIQWRWQVLIFLPFSHSLCLLLSSLSTNLGN